MRGDASCLSCQQSQRLAQHRDTRGPRALAHIQLKKGLWARDNKNGNSHAGALCCAADVLVALIIYQGFFHDQ